LKDSILDCLFLVYASLFSKNVKGTPECLSSLLPVYLGSYMFEIVFHFFFTGSSMATWMLNISDVPFTFGSGREEYQALTSQKKDSKFSIFLDDIE
jgi:hypothetical protein